MTWSWSDDARSFGAFVHRLECTRDQAARHAREQGCPERLIARVLDGWDRARLEARHTTA